MQEFIPKVYLSFCLDLKIVEALKLHYAQMSTRFKRGFLNIIVIIPEGLGRGVSKFC